MVVGVGIIRVGVGGILKEGEGFVVVAFDGEFVAVADEVLGGIEAGAVAFVGEGDWALEHFDLVEFEGAVVLHGEHAKEGLAVADEIGAELP